jgi:hypothetical protein
MSADREFQIKIVTTAEGAGTREAEQGLEGVGEAGEAAVQPAEDAREAAGRLEAEQRELLELLQRLVAGLGEYAQFLTSIGGSGIGAGAAQGAGGLAAALERAVRSVDELKGKLEASVKVMEATGVAPAPMIRLEKGRDAGAGTGGAVAATTNGGLPGVVTSGEALGSFARLGEALRGVCAEGAGGAGAQLQQAEAALGRVVERQTALVNFVGRLAGAMERMPDFGPLFNRLGDLERKMEQLQSQIQAKGVLNNPGA